MVIGVADETREQAAYERGSKAPLIEAFQIDGLYGYRSIALSADYAATILIAKNGSGKTTLIGALNAVLCGQFGRLKDLHFTSLTLKLRGVSEIVLTKPDIVSYSTSLPDTDLESQAIANEVEPGALYRFLTEEYEEQRRDGRLVSRLSSDPNIIERFLRNNGYKRTAVTEILNGLQNHLAGKVPAIASALTVLRAALKGVEIVYLPTYRRIELPWEAPDEGRVLRRKRPFKISGSGLFTGDIQFGLADISERLSDMNQTILLESNQGYRELSASIINELINGNFEQATVESTLPDKDELELFFSRLKEGESARIGPYNPISIPNIDRIYSTDDISGTTKPFLLYFLGKLNRVIQATRDVEVQVQDFVRSCNRYLSATEVSTTLDPATLSQMDRKQLTLNRKNLSVQVESLIGGRSRPISLDALSSGEKQMISLFAKLFLYPKEKVVLIDEPELSLSIEWQQKILVDVLNAPSSAQVIAITHSPFVFDNALDPFARSLKMSVDIDALSARDEEIEPEA